MFYSNQNCAFKILGIFGVARAPQEVFATNRSHTALSYRIKGDSTFWVDGKEYEVKNGSVVYIPRGVDFRRKSTEEELIILHLDSLGEDIDPFKIIDHAENLEPLFQKLLSIWEERDSTAYNRAMSVLYTIFEALQKMTEVKSPTLPPLIMPGVALMRSKWKDPSLTVAELAEACFVSEVYFRHIWREHFGVSPLQSLLSLRFDYACNLLRSGDYTLKEIALLSGFSDIKYFRTAFTKRFGILSNKIYAKSVLTLIFYRQG